MLVELHFIQNFAPSNLNRDDTNNPKDCTFGGVRRARISSQCLKRAIRYDPSFAIISGVPVSQRTRLMAGKLRNALEKTVSSTEKAKLNSEKFTEYYSSKKAKLDDGKTNVMLFISDGEIKEICLKLQKMETDEEIKKYAEEFAKNNSSHPGAPDIAMFGRMLADRPETNVDAACQVAHAISTHAVAMDLDFFTAVDDLLKEGETGAGMMGVTGFNSACFYRYACIDFAQLVKNLNGSILLARDTVKAFLHASTSAIPSGKQNSFAAHNPPSFLMAVVREDGQNWSLANAFEKPVCQSRQKSLVQSSVEALDAYWGKMNAFFDGQTHVFTAVLDDGAELDSLKGTSVLTFSQWVESVVKQLPQE